MTILVVSNVNGLVIVSLHTMAQIRKAFADIVLSLHDYRPFTWTERRFGGGVTSKLRCLAMSPASHRNKRLVEDVPLPVPSQWDLVDGVWSDPAVFHAAAAAAASCCCCCMLLLLLLLLAARPLDRRLACCCCCLRNLCLCVGRLISSDGVSISSFPLAGLTSWMALRRCGVEGVRSIGFTPPVAFGTLLYSTQGAIQMARHCCRESYLDSPVRPT